LADGDVINPVADFQRWKRGHKILCFLKDVVLQEYCGHGLRRSFVHAETHEHRVTGARRLDRYRDRDDRMMTTFGGS
jgi:hypothetical protein